MKILLISAGSLGDIEHFVAIEELLRGKGHDVICAFPEQFKNLLDESSARFISLGSANTNFLESKEFKMLGGKGSVFKKMQDNMRFGKKAGKLSEELGVRAHKIIKEEKPDRVLFNWIVNYPIIWGIKNPNKSILISPAPCYIHYMKNHMDMAFHGNNYGSFLNKLTYKLANFMWIGGLKECYNQINSDEKVTKKITQKQIENALVSNRIIYTISPAIFPRPDYWPENAQVLGYHERTNTVNGYVNEDLNCFMAKHDKILLITLGSMTNPEPEENTKIILDILEQHQIPAIINIASGGLIEPVEYNADLIHFVKYIPYDWILPRVYGILHHGGSGTMHLALKYGCASMIIPQMGDQYVWNNVVSDLGVGPKGMGISKLTKQNLEPKILDLYENWSYKAKAIQISEEMRKEDFREKLYKTIIE